MNYEMNQLAEDRAAEMRADAAVRRYAAEHRVRRSPVRTGLGRALVRLGERLAAAPARPAATR